MSYIPSLTQYITLLTSHTSQQSYTTAMRCLDLWEPGNEGQTHYNERLGSVQDSARAIGPHREKCHQLLVGIHYNI